MGIPYGSPNETRVARILVMDDETAIRHLLETFLTKEGFEVEVAPDGAAGLEIHRADPFDAVVTDILMPQKEGFETIQELRVISPDLRIIAMSGGGRNSPNTYLEFAKAFGADRTFVKPFSPKLLVAAIVEMLGGNRILLTQSAH